MTSALISARAPTGREAGGGGRPGATMKIAVLMVLLPALIPTVGVAQQAMISIEIRGRVETDEGQQIADCELQLSFTKNIVDTNWNPVSKVEQNVVHTDGEGYYSFQLQIEPDWTDFNLRLSTPRVERNRFRPPSPKQLTAMIQNGIKSGRFAFEVNWLVRSRPRWKKLQEEIDRYGENSDKGRLLRERGFPDHIEEKVLDGRLRSIWYFYNSPVPGGGEDRREGLAIRFIGDAKEKEFRFAPDPSRG